ncbi:MAG TPA: nucleotidyltransferase family protein [Gaiellaceae bacterium]|nr:nucleotidyltransferase family protein [Gaiellaceae bacterium]
MKAVILAAGYATRLRPLTDDVPKHLLPVGDRPMLDWVLDKIREVDEVDGVHLVTNSRFASAFACWAESHEVVVQDDGTTSNEDRLGAVGDLGLVIDAARLNDEELLVLAGDNLFDLSLPRFVEWWRGKPQPSSAVPLHDVGDLELATQYGVATTDADDLIVQFVEKPTDPPSTLASTLIYLLPPEHVRLVTRYLDAGESADNAGSFLGWLARYERVYGYRFEGSWFDIGGREQLLEADNRLRRLTGLPEREEYSLD